MDLKRGKLILAMFMAFALSYFAQNHVFTVNGEEVKPEVLVAFHNLPETLEEVTHSIKFERAPTPTPTPYAIPLFPTGSLVVAPSVIVQPTQIIYPPTQPPIPVDPEPTIFEADPTPIPLPTIFYPPTAIPQPTRVPPTNRPQPTAIPTVPSTPNLTMEDFGRCLNQNGMVMYGQPGCPACSQQKQLLGAAYSQIKVVNCPSQPAECQQVGVRTTPSWAKNGVMAIPGGTSLDYLAQVAGCQLPN